MEIVIVDTAHDFHSGRSGVRRDNILRDPRGMPRSTIIIAGRLSST